MTDLATAAHLISMRDNALWESDVIQPGDTVTYQGGFRPLIGRTADVTWVHPTWGAGLSFQTPAGPVRLTHVDTEVLALARGRNVTSVARSFVPDPDTAA